MASVLEVLQNADYNLQNARSQFQIDIAKVQLHNAVILLKKDYDLHDDVDEVIADHEKVEHVPEKTISSMLES